jgi:phosphoglycerate dehydrogenase-like enzyme
MSVIACSSNGIPSPQRSFRLAGTGDPDGTIPLEWYSSTDKTSFHTFLRRSDVLVLSVPSTANTAALVDREAIAQLNPSAILINVGRGSTIDQDALVEALKAGKFAGAALDVTNPEPLPDGHSLFSLPNVIVTGVCALYSLFTDDFSADMLLYQFSTSLP